MEDWDIVEMIKRYIKNMETEGNVYFYADETLNAIRWHNNNHDWLIIISVGKRGALKGSLYIIDQTRPILAEQLVANVKFNPYDPYADDPFRPILENTKFYEWFNEQRKGTKSQSIKFAQEYLVLLNLYFLKADEKTLNSTIFHLKNRTGAGVDPPGVFSGGAVSPR